jgi:MFS family permease
MLSYQLLFTKGPDLGGSCAFTPLYGRTSDIYGRKALLLIAGTTFTVATLGCGVAQSMGELLFWRTIAGIGGGGLMSMASVVMSDLVSQRRRGLLQGACALPRWRRQLTGTPLQAPVTSSLRLVRHWAARSEDC